MKKTILAVVIALVAFGCGNKDEKENKDMNTTGKTGQPNVEQTEVIQPANTTEAFTCAYIFKPKERFSYKVTSVTKNRQEIAGDTSFTINANQKVTYFFDFDVMEVDNEGTAELSVNIKTIESEADFNGEKILYSSNNSYPEEEKLKYLEFETIVNNPFRLRVKNTGEIIEVTRMDKFVDRFIAMNKAEGKVSAAEKEQLKMNFSEGLLKPMIQQVFRLVPNKVVDKDSTWNQSYTSKVMIFEMENNVGYKLTDFVKINDQLAAKVKGSLKVKVKGDKSYTEQGITYNFDTPKINGGGDVYFRISDGRLLKANTGTTVEFRMNIDAKPTGAPAKKATRKEFTESKNIVELI